MESTTGLEPTHSPNYQGYKLPERISEGERNRQLYSYASKLQAQEYSDDDIERMVKQANGERCNPPVTECEVARIVRNATSHPKGRDPEYEKRNEGSSDTKQAGLELPKSINDRSLSRLFGERYRDRLRWVKETRCWYCYDGTRWADGTSGGNELAEGMMKEFVGDLCIAAATCSDPDQRVVSMKAVAKYNDSTKRRNLLRDSHNELSTSIKEFDTDLKLINCRNVTVELGAVIKTHPHTPKDMLTKVAGCDYDKDAGHGQWDKFLSETFKGREKVIPFFQERMGLALAGDTSRDCFYLAIGQTRTGKSTTVNTIKNVFGEYKTTADAATFTESSRRAQNASPDYACLRGARLVDVPELAEGMILDIALVKRITGGDELTARALRQDPITFTPICTLIMPTNFKPRMKDETLFTSKRVVILPFYNTRGENEQDYGLEQRMCEPKFASSVLNWIIEGYQRAVTIGSKVPDICEELANDYSRDEDIIGAFIEDECTEVDGIMTDGSSIYSRYRTWSIDNGYQPASANNFYKRLVRRGYRRSSGRVKTGSGTKSVRNRIHGLTLKYDGCDDVRDKPAFRS